MDTDRHLHHVRTYPVGTRVQYTFDHPARLGQVVDHLHGEHASAIIIKLDDTGQTVTVGTLYLRKA